MDNTLKGTNVEFNKNTKQKIIKINSGYFWVPPRISVFDLFGGGLNRGCNIIHTADVVSAVMSEIVPFSQTENLMP
jgi:hypothetical protein